MDVKSLQNNPYFFVFLMGDAQIGIETVLRHWEVDANGTMGYILEKNFSSSMQNITIKHFEMQLGETNVYGKDEFAQYLAKLSDKKKERLFVQRIEVRIPIKYEKCGNDFLQIKNNIKIGSENIYMDFFVAVYVSIYMKENVVRFTVEHDQINAPARIALNAFINNLFKKHVEKLSEDKMFACFRGIKAQNNVFYKFELDYIPFYFLYFWMLQQGYGGVLFIREIKREYLTDELVYGVPFFRFIFYVENLTTDGGSEDAELELSVHFALDSSENVTMEIDDKLEYFLRYYKFIFNKFYFDRGVMEEVKSQLDFNREDYGVTYKIKKKIYDLMEVLIKRMGVN